MSASPAFFVTPRHAAVNSGGSANTIKLYGATVNLTVAVVTGVAAGTIVERVTVIQNGAAASVTTANNICRFFIFDGTNYSFVHEVNLGGASTASQTAVGLRITVPELVGLKLPSASHVLHVGFSQAAAGDTFTISAQVADM